MHKDVLRNMTAWARVFSERKVKIMKEKWEEFKTSLTDVTSMTKKEFLLTITVCILGGIVFGLLFSPRKSMMIGSNNGNNNGRSLSDRDIEEAEKNADWENEE